MQQISKGGAGHLLRIANGATGPTALRRTKVPPSRSKPKRATMREGAVAWGENSGLITKAVDLDAELERSASEILELVEKAEWSDEKLAHRKKVGAALGTTGAVIGLSSLAAKGGRGALLRIKPSSRTAKIAEHLDSVTSNALVVGAGIGGAAGLNGASVARQEAARVKQQSKVKKGAEMDEELSKAKADQAIRRRMRAVTGTGSKPPAAPKVPPSGFGAKASRLASAGMRSLKTPQGKLVGLAAAGTAAGVGTAAYVAHRRKQTIGKSAFGVDHVIEIDKAFDPLKPAKAAQTFASGVTRAFGRGTAAAGAKAAVRPRAMTALAGASKNPVERAAFKTGNATKNFGAGFSRKPPSPSAKAMGTHITAGNSTNTAAFKGGRMVRQYGVPAAVAGTGAYAGTKLANSNNRSRVGKSAFGVDHEVSKARADQKLRRARRAAVAPKVPPTTSSGVGAKLAGAGRFLGSGKGRLVAAGVGVGAAGAGTAAYVHHRSRVGKSAFGVEHEVVEKGAAQAAKDVYAGYHTGRALDSSRKLASATGDLDALHATHQGEKAFKAKAPKMARIGGHFGRYNGTYAHNTGLGVGVVAGVDVARSRRKKKEMGVSKADRRFTGERSTTPLYLAKHSEQAANLRSLKPKAKPVAAAIRDTLRVTTLGKSAFGVDHEVLKSVGYDSEADRHRRAGVAAGVLGVGAAGMATGAAHQARAAVRSGKAAQGKFKHATGRAKNLAEVKNSAKEAGRLVRATNVHGARAAGLAVGAASLGSAAGAVIHHNKNGGKSYNGWYS